MKLKKLRIQNFQSHQDTTVTFTDGLNVLLGPTDVGKSSILRALRKLIRDVPGGKSFISKWADEMSISLTFDYQGDTHTITRKVTPSKNMYILDDEEYGGFGKTIPEEIVNALNMQLVTLETGEEIDLFFSDQHDPPFMITKGMAGIRSKLIGKIAGLHVLDRAIVRVNSDIRAQNTKLKHRGEEISSLEYELEDFPDMWHELELIETIKTDIDNVRQLCTKEEELKKFITELKDLEEVIQDIQRLTKDLPDLTKKKAKINFIKSNLQLRYEMSRILEELDYCNDQIREVSEAVPPEIKANIKDIKDIKNKISEYEVIHGIYTRLSEIVKEAAELQNDETSVQLENAVKEHKEILAKLGTCPTCNQPLKETQDGRQ